MNIGFRLLLSLGFTITALSLLNIAALQPIQALLLPDTLTYYLNRSFLTTCLILRIPIPYPSSKNIDPLRIHTVYPSRPTYQFSFLYPRTSKQEDLCLVCL